jgi:hypothetical protein
MPAGAVEAAGRPGWVRLRRPTIAEESDVNDRAHDGRRSEDLAPPRGTPAHAAVGSAESPRERFDGDVPR